MQRLFCFLNYCLTSSEPRVLVGRPVAHVGFPGVNHVALAPVTSFLTLPVHRSLCWPHLVRWPLHVPRQRNYSLTLALGNVRALFRVFCF